MAISARKRFFVLHRDGFTCRYCGRRPPEIVLHVEHIVPRSKGGSDEEDNLLAACTQCNIGKATDLIQGVGLAGERLDPFQEVSVALSELVSASYWLVYGENLTQKHRDNFVQAYVNAEEALVNHSDLPETDGYYQTVREHREWLAGALAKLGREAEGDAD